METIKQNEDYILILNLQYADTLQPIDLTDVQAFSELRENPGGELKAQGTCAVSTSGKITVTYSSASTAQLEPGEYGFDVWIVDSQNKKHPIWETRVEVKKPYTENYGD